MGNTIKFRKVSPATKKCPTPAPTPFKKSGPQMLKMKQHKGNKIHIFENSENHTSTMFFPTFVPTQLHYSLVLLLSTRDRRVCLVPGFTGRITRARWKTSSCLFNFITSLFSFESKTHFEISFKFLLSNCV